MSRNCFEITKKELWFLIISSQCVSIAGFDEELPQFELEDAKACAESLKEKGCINSSEDGKMALHEMLATCMYMITHSTGYSKCTSEGGEMLIFYYYEDSIVSLHIANEKCEIIWLPLITLAIGEAANVTKKDGCYKWKYCARSITGDYYEEYIPEENENDTEVLKKFFDLSVTLHGRAIKIKNG